ncbi:MAG: sigma-54 dependent transcriptional regulator [Planctomycetia bacterium]|nr:sigma-54 dependent transcriptional regulator [Planctomycetia bacterium]
MKSITTLLVTRDPSVINDIRHLHDDIEYAQLEVCGRLEKVPARLNQPNTLLLIHRDPSTDPAPLRAILGAAARALIRAVVVSSPGVDGRPHTPDVSADPVYYLPDDLPALRELLHSVHAAKVRTSAPHTPPANPVDPITASLLGSELDDHLVRIRRVANQPTTILLTGETGSGKSMLARFIHAVSPRRDEPYLVVDCGALSGHLIESEMFGHVRGAFTGAERDRQGKFAAAGTGTLVLDEINSLPLPLQTKLLRAVEERVFEPVGSNKSEPLRARLIAISNVPLEDEIRRERFRADLFYRLNVVEFRIPPLRERPGAVIPIAHQLLRASATATCQGVSAISPAAIESMLRYNWPGNVRELRNVIERAAALATGPVIQLDDLPESIRGSAVMPALSLASLSSAKKVGAVPFPVEGSIPLVAAGDNEAARILAVLQKHNNNRRKAAAELGLSRVSLYKKLHRYGLFVRKQRTSNAG